MLYAVYLVPRGGHVLAGVLWSSYGMLDNLDGCQARKTGTSSRAGEFLDHAIDSLVSSLASFVMMRSLFDITTADGAAFIEAWQPIAVVVAGNVPFFLGCWAHHVVGRLMIGPSFHGSDWFTVDEFNILTVPAIMIMRGAFPAFWDLEIVTGITLGFCLFVFSIGISIIITVVVGFQLLQKSSIKAGAVLLAPLSFWLVATYVLRVTFAVRAVTFSALAIEVIVLRFGVHSRGVTRVRSLPVSHTVPVVAGCSRFSSALSATNADVDAGTGGSMVGVHLELLLVSHEEERLNQMSFVCWQLSRVLAKLLSS